MFWALFTNVCLQGILEICKQERVNRGGGKTLKVKMLRKRKSPDTGTKYQAGTPETQPSATESEIHPSHKSDDLCSVYFATASSFSS